MKELQKISDPPPQRAAVGDPASDGLGTARNELDDLHAAGDAAIDAALSTDSAAFLASTQQTGGQ